MARIFPTGIDLQSQKAVNMADGSAANDGATWGQVQAFLAGLAWKAAVRAASTANINLSAPGASIDGVTLSAGDRFLAKDQTTASANGIYVFATASTAATRATDMDSAAETKSATVLIMEGTTNADKAFTQTADAVTLGTTSLTFVQFGGSNTYTNGNGLNLTSGTFSIKLPGSGVVGLIVDGTGIYIDTSVVVRKYAANFGDGSATSYTITHNLGLRDVQVTVFDNTSYVEEYPDVTHTTANTVTLAYATAPASNAKRAVVQG